MQVLSVASGNPLRLNIGLAQQFVHTPKLLPEDFAKAAGLCGRSCRAASGSGNCPGLLSLPKFTPLYQPRRLKTLDTHAYPRVLL
jgi:hypothetical protein